MDTKLNISEAATRLGVSERHVRRMCMQGKLAGAVRDGDGWLIPATAHAKLLDEGRPDKEFDLTVLPKHKQDIALRRRGIVQEAEAFAANEVRQGRDRLKALRAFASQAQVGLRTLQRWMSEFRKKGIEGLVDTRGMNDGPAPEISAEAWQEFESLYLDLKRPSVKTIYDVVVFMSQQQGLAWRLPGLRRMQQLVHERIPYKVLVLNREGRKAYEGKCAPYIEIDMDTIEPGAIWVGDHHQCDCWIRYRGEWIRPWLTAWEDWRSRMIVGYCLTDSPNSTTILRAFKRGCQRFGPPDGVKIDNGKDYDSEMWNGITKQQRRLKLAVDESTTAGIYAMMDISVSFANPYNAKAKPIERWFETLEMQFIKTIPTYCSNNTLSRPEPLQEYLNSPKAIEEALSLDEFGGMLAEYIEIYNHSSHRGRGMDGQTPIEVFNKRRSRRMVDEKTLDLLCQVWSGQETIGKNGIAIRGLHYGTYDPAIMARQGRKVRCSWEPDDMSRVLVYDAHTWEFLGIAGQHTQLGHGTTVTDEDQRRAHADLARAKRIVKQYKSAARVAATDLPRLTLQAARSRVKETEAEANKPIRPVRTPLDGQAAAVRRTERVRAVRKAAGAEGLRTVVNLEWDEPVTVDRPQVSLDWDEQETTAAPSIKLEFD
ncbi:MAG: DDE-type integrase/transposase/recombinase [Planctomycetaceae bacterium]|nr:DDE-type integrase/transposase/recombinase [Planctomycetaceae bacterium]